MGINSRGYKTRTSGEYLETILDNMNREFPNMSNSSNNLAVVIARELAAVLEENDNIRAEGYNNVYVGTATGVHLDKAVTIAGISRRDGTRSYGKALFTKTDDIQSISIAPNTLLLSNNVKYYTTNTGFVTINTSGGVEIEIASAEKGSHTNLTKMSKLTPSINIRGLRDITCAPGTTGGTDTETDQELRKRYYIFMGSYNNTSLQGVMSEIRKLPDVLRVSGKENMEDITVDGLPPHSFALFVEGASDNDIANKIFEVKPAGIQTHGDTTVQIKFESETYPISFSRFNKQTIYYSIKVRPNSGVGSVTLESDLKEAIKKFTATTDVINHSELVGYLFNNVDGIAAFLNVSFGLTPDPTGDTEITIETGKVFMTYDDKIKITVTGGV